MNIRENISLLDYNTFGIDVKAKFFAQANTLDELIELSQSNLHPRKFILSGGSNILLSNDIDALVIQMNLKGIEIVSTNENEVIVQAMAGENWHEFVHWCIEHNFGGLENLSLIPGLVGTSPIQNIGAYGVEIKDCFESCDAIEIATGKAKTFSKEDCEFGYRDSIFKQKAENKYIIYAVRFRLTSTVHQIKTQYGTIQEELASNGITNPTIKDVSKAIIAIRSSKLPDPKITGNCGSFFKNPVVSKTIYNKIKENYPEAPSYPIDEDQVKIPAAWLIEKSGFKGMTKGNVGVHDKQALVLINKGNALGNEVIALAEEIIKTVIRIFQIHLEIEVRVIH